MKNVLHSSILHTKNMLSYNKSVKIWLKETITYNFDNLYNNVMNCHQKSVSNLKNILNFGTFTLKPCHVFILSNCKEKSHICFEIQHWKNNNNFKIIKNKIQLSNCNCRPSFTKHFNKNNLMTKNRKKDRTIKDAKIPN